MPYKDKDKQKQASRAAKARWKAKAVAVALGIPESGIPDEGIPGIPDRELCQYCDKPLPKLLKPRRNPGACYDCALKQPRKPSIVALGDTVYAGAEYVPPAGD